MKSLGNYWYARTINPIPCHVVECVGSSVDCGGDTTEHLPG